jgi:predicted AlkP superfamily phosphohydrolase/phosphomutase
MTNMITKICSFGMDGFIIPMMKYFVGEGYLPNFSRLLKEGSVNQTQPDFPVWTPTNWATLSTGAHTGTHGASRWSVDAEDGSRIDSFDGRAITAERIWNALERKGMKSIAVHYPAAEPSGIEIGYSCDGFGHPGYSHTSYEIAPAQAYTTEENPENVEFEHDGTAFRSDRQGIVSIPPLQSARGWHNLPGEGLPPLSSKIKIISSDGDSNFYYLLVLGQEDSGYDHVLICRAKDAGSVIASTSVGEWSDWVIQDFTIHSRQQRASVRFKLMNLSSDGSLLKLYRTQVTFADGFTNPPELAEQIISRFGPYQEHASFTPFETRMTDFETALSECEYQGLWFADIANFMLHEENCTFFICHWHLFDYLNHLYLNMADPVCPGYDQSLSDQHLGYFRKAYQVADKILGRLLEAADTQTVISIISDHGAYPDERVANIRKFLYEKGFLVLKPGVDICATIDQDWVSEQDIDWKKTRAYLKAEKGFDIFINASADDEFSLIERQLLRALRTWVDEEVGRTPIAVALPKRDAYLLNQWGDQCGDVVFAWDHGYVSGYLGQWKSIQGGGTVGAPEEFGAHHGGFIPTESKISSTFGSFMLMGSGIKAGYERSTGRFGYIHAVDIVPTYCHMLGVDPPAQSQGAIARDIFEGHNINFDRFSQKACTE